MGKIVTKDPRERRKRRVFFKIGKTKIPQLKVFRSNKHIYAQVIDYLKNVTLASFSDLKLETSKKLTKKEKAYQVGLKLAEELKKLSINKIVFNRGYYRYLGRVKALVEGVRAGGIKV